MAKRQYRRDCLDRHSRLLAIRRDARPIINLYRAALREIKKEEEQRKRDKEDLEAAIKFLHRLKGVPVHDIAEKYDTYTRH